MANVTVRVFITKIEASANKFMKTDPLMYFFNLSFFQHLAFTVQTLRKMLFSQAIEMIWESSYSQFSYRIFFR